MTLSVSHKPEPAQVEEREENEQQQKVKQLRQSIERTSNDDKKLLCFCSVSFSRNFMQRSPSAYCCSTQYVIPN